MSRFPVPLPEPGQRWTPARKEAVIHHLRRAPEDRDNLVARYGLGPEELAAWERRWKQHGQAGLKATKLERSSL